MHVVIARNSQLTHPLIHSCTRSLASSSCVLCNGCNVLNLEHERTNEHCQWSTEQKYNRHRDAMVRACSRVAALEALVVYIVC